GKADGGANMGTAVHRMAEKIDRGEPLGTIPEAYRADLEAYSHATKCLKMTDIERFCVLDSLGVGGTPDRRALYRGQSYIVDIKTGKIDWPGEMAMQLAIYAHSHWYDPTTGQREPIECSQTHGIIIHLPAGQGVCQLYWLNIAAGWDAVQLVPQIMEYRKLEKRLTAPLVAVEATQPVDVREQARSLGERLRLTAAARAAIEKAETSLALQRIFEHAQSLGIWGDDLMHASNRRRTQLREADAMTDALLGAEAS
ncbi:MAG: hypothetical protein JOZ81_06675, partial [Chloroflexi bacterium]|nr:hypothetical protein [Chloroflexota bacterium]